MMKNNSYPYDVCIIGGLGHVGLPLGISLAQCNKKVVLYDIDQKAAQTVAMGKMPFMEAGAEEVLQQVIEKTLFVSLDSHVISKSYFLIIIIGTPVDEHLNPKLTHFMRLFEEITDRLQDDQHIILRSTIYPVTTEKMKRYLESRGKKTKLSFCPERIAEGKTMQELRDLPQIVSSFDEASLEEVKGLFSLLTNETLSLSPIEAELAKLFTNTWRYIYFSISNQFYQIATQQGLDFYKIYNAITYQYPRAQNFPTPGFTAGPCLFKDTMQLAAFSNHGFTLGHAAMLINEGLPNFIVNRLKEKYTLKDKTVGIMGMAFKANSDDKRESLSYKLKRILRDEAKEVLCSDVYIQDSSFVSAEDLVHQAEIIIIGTPHQEYFHFTIPENKTLVDVWNFYGKGGLF